MDTDRLKEALQFVERETHLRTKSYRMLSDGVQGEFLQAFSLMSRPANILEIGTFTGYATLCLYRGLREDGLLETIESDDEMTDIFSRAFSIAGADRICAIHGDAEKVIPTLGRMYDIVYIDADKRKYSTFYDLVFDKVRHGGYILADNVLWSGKPDMPSAPHDIQTESIIGFNMKTASDPRVERLTIPIRDGLALIRKK